MLVVGLVAGVLAVILLLWGLLRLVRRYLSRWHFVGFIVLAAVSLVSLYLGRPYYAVKSVAEAGNPHAYVVRVETVNSEKSHLEAYARDIIQQVRQAHPDAVAVEVEFFAPHSSTWQSRAVWGAYSDAREGEQGVTTDAANQTVFDYVLP
ncbi:hypothetical protein [Alicyclobacillus kakegawensis]|uniref:hypothetical protein n=1 Tax=Alicyclobacillus kakegawensis TaxID=392012 RepID=UPI000829788E|nr:hypothetical protein [Alicyclobacillus kakegawensis]